MSQASRPDDDTAGGFWVRNTRDADVHTVALAGDLDVTSVARFERELAVAEASDAPIIALDLRELEFIDCSGLRAIVAAHQRRGSRLTVIEGPPHIQRLFEICDLLTLFSFADDTTARRIP
jgi:anti-anti-sigma factor